MRLTNQATQVYAVLQGTVLEAGSTICRSGAVQQQAVSNQPETCSSQFSQIVLLLVPKRLLTLQTTAVDTEDVHMLFSLVVAHACAVPH
jgi:hypothetical protein